MVAAARGPRPKRTARDFLRMVPPPQFMVKKVLGVDFNGLAGPSEAGKSLLARDWGLHIAAGVPWRGYPVSTSRGACCTSHRRVHTTSRSGGTFAATVGPSRRTAQLHPGRAGEPDVAG